MKKRAVLVGINYPGTDHELRGCVNDVNIIHSMLIDHYGFKYDDVVILTNEQATTENILNNLESMVSASSPGDTVFFHYSGHGSQIYDRKNDSDIEVDGLDEILCPIDLNWTDKVIRDDDLKRIFDKIPNGVFFTIVLDCCNSGSGLDHDTQYQPIVEVNTRDLKTPFTDHRSRFLPPPENMINEACSRQIPLMARKLGNRDINKTGMLISGCRADQTSADAFFNGRYIGACTYFLTSIISEHNHNITYRQLIEELNNKLAHHGFTQRPELDGPKSLYDHPFISYNRNEPEQVVEGPDNNIKPEHQEQPISNNQKPHGFWQKIVHFFTVVLPSWFK